MNILISETSDTPIYQQITDQLQAQILRGDLPPGTPLPPIRTAARELRISVITVKKAWEQLEGMGLIVTRVGRGTEVSALTAQQLQNTKAEILNTNLANDLRVYQEMGFSQEEIIESIKKHFSK